MSALSADRAPVVLVIGASSGIGQATARLLARKGDRLVLASRSKRRLEQVAGQCRREGASAVSVCPLDVRDRAAVERVVEAVVAEHGRVDAVINTAGVAAYGRFEEIPTDIFDGVVATNLTGSANVARAVLPVLRQQSHGVLVLLGSVIGDIAVPELTPYAVSKHAVASLGRQLAIENRDIDGVRISVVSPGAVDTPIYRQAANFSGRPGQPPVPVESAERVAKAIVDDLERPHDRVSVGLANQLMRAGFSLTPKLFDRLVGPLFRMVALAGGEQPPSGGNVMDPLPAGERQTGSG